MYIVNNSKNNNDLTVSTKRIKIAINTQIY